MVARSHRVGLLGPMAATILYLLGPALGSAAFAAPPVALPPLGASDPAAGCVPACLPGAQCSDGRCLSLCDPRCRAGEFCSDQGVCLVPVEPGVTRPAPPIDPAEQVRARIAAGALAERAQIRAERLRLREERLQARLEPRLTLAGGVQVGLLDQYERRHGGVDNVAVVAATIALGYRHPTLPPQLDPGDGALSLLVDDGRPQLSSAARMEYVPISPADIDARPPIAGCRELRDEIRTQIAAARACASDAECKSIVGAPIPGDATVCLTVNRASESRLAGYATRWRASCAIDHTIADCAAGMPPRCLAGICAADR